MTKKITYVEAIDEALNGEMTEEVKNKLEVLKVVLQKRNSHKSDKPTKTQKENENIKAEILEIISDGKAYQCKTIATQLNLTGQKVSALLKQMVENGLVTKSTEKRITYFTKV